MRSLIHVIRERSEKFLSLQVIACKALDSVQVLACMQNHPRSGLQEIEPRPHVGGEACRKDGNMSELVRWKEYRVRQEIYKERLKQSETSAAGVGSGEATTEELNRISVAFFEQIFGKRREQQSPLTCNV
jgi:hypothetical protein